MRFLAILILIIVGCVGAYSFLRDSGDLVEPLKESAAIVQKLKEEESAFLQFCEGQKLRDEARKVSPATAQTTDAANSASPKLGVQFLKHKDISFDHNPFGHDDFKHLGQPVSLSPAPAAPAPAAAVPASDNSSGSSQAQQAQSSSNPIMRTWGGYVSQIENAEK